jgi:hypothetical protein
VEQASDPLHASSTTRARLLLGAAVPNPELQTFIGSVGAAPQPPEITVGEAVASPDQF